MPTSFRLAPIGFSTFAIVACLLALGCFDTTHAQTLTVSTSTLAFTAAQGNNPNPPSQSVTTGGTGNFIISISASWISASTGPFNGNGGTAGNTLIVQVNSASLAAGNYSGTITLTPTAGGSTPVPIAVTLAVSGNGNTTSFLSASPSQLSFGFELNHAAPVAQTVQILSSGISLPFSFSTTTAPTSNCPQGWLQVTGGANTTPGTLTVGIVTTGLGPGTCTGSITVTSNTPGNGTSTTSIGVTLFVSGSALLNVNIPAGLSSVTLQAGVRPAQFVIQLTSTDPNTPVPFSVVTTGSWLNVVPSTGVTPASLTVQITPGNGVALPIGTYNGSIQITSPGLFNNTLTIPITFNLTSGSSVTVSPAGTQNFTELQGGALPSSQTLTLTGSTSSTFLASVTQATGGSWLAVSPSNGSLTPGSPATLTLSVAPNTLTQGTYSSQVTISFQNSSIPSIVVFVSLTVAPPASALVATPPGLTFSYQSGAAAPGAQTVTITNAAVGSVPYTVEAVSDNWISSVTPSSGSTPGNISVSVSPQNLQTGAYNGSFTLTSPGLPSLTVSVALFVSASTTPQPFIIGNAASGVGGQLAPGEIISIKGSGLGPGTPVSFTVNGQGGVGSSLAGVQVTFNGVAGTLLYVSSTQINVIVPYEIAGQGSTTIVVSNQGVLSTGIVQPVGIASLGLFTDNATGSGQAAAVNSNYAYNTPATPALQGSYISVYATGGGQTNPLSFDGEVSPTASLLPLALQSSVTATIGGRAAAVLFAGAAPGYVAGVVQFNIQVPIGVNGPALPIVVTISGSTVVQSQPGATVAVQ